MKFLAGLVVGAGAFYLYSRMKEASVLADGAGRPRVASEVVRRSLFQEDTIDEPVHVTPPSPAERPTYL